MTKKIIYIDNFLTKHGYTPTIGATIANLLTNEGFTVVKTSSVKNKLLRLVDMLYTLFKNRKNSVALITVYSGSAFYFAYACAWLCRLLHIEYIPCLHGGNLPQRIKNSPKLCEKLFRNSKINVAVSGYLENAVKQNTWNVTVIPNPINIQNYPFTERVSTNLKIFWLRSFHEIYNPLLAVELIYELKKKYSFVSLTMVGPDKDGSLEVCKKRVAELNLQDNIVFTGLLSLQEWVALSTSHDLFLNTTNFDNLPVSLIEAMALGFPVITTNAGGIPYLIEQNINGILVPTNNVQTMLDTVEALYQNPSITNQLSIQARKTAEQYDWSNIKLQWKKILS